MKRLIILLKKHIRMFNINLMREFFKVNLKKITLRNF
jgi:hypothetical protein